MSTATVKLPGRSSRAKVIMFAAIAAVVFFGGLVLYATFTTYVLPDHVAVRQVYLGPNKGIQEDLYGPGLHFVMPGYERLHTFPRSVQLLEFNDDEVTKSEDSFHQPAIRIQTSEGYQVTVDVVIAYRIVDPYQVMTQVGPGKLYLSSLVSPRSDKVLRQKLGELNAEDFYSGFKRRHAAEEARELLERDIETSGIQVWNVMVRHYTYDRRYQEAIEQRKIQDQTVFKNKAEAVAATQEAEKNRVTAEGQALVEVEKQRGRSDIMKIEASADLYYRQQIAEGDLLVALAEAEGTRLENAALETGGAGNLVGLEMAKVLEGADVIVVPTDGPQGLNPLNLDSLLRGW